MDSSKPQTCSEPAGLIDDTLVPLAQLRVSAVDRGFIHGITVSEQVRTFRQQPFLLDKHYQRWARGLDAIGLKPPCSAETLAARIEKLIGINAAFLPPDCEQGICFFATVGAQPSFCWPGSEGASQQAQCFVHSYPLPSDHWQEHYERGVHLRTTAVQDVPAQSWPTTVKIRSRLHYYLAQREAEQIQPGCHPILLDWQGQVSDSAIGSIIGYHRSEGLVVRPKSIRYWSISVDFVLELAASLGIQICERLFSVPELQEFDEAFLVSTPWCIFPVSTIDGRSLVDSRTLVSHERFAIHRQLIDAWSACVGVPI
jgi:branched-chain amino acid aminotransferase